MRCTSGCAPSSTALNENFAPFRFSSVPRDRAPPSTSLTTVELPQPPFGDVNTRAKRHVAAPDTLFSTLTFRAGS